MLYNDNNFLIPKLKVFDVLKEATLLYKDNFRLLIKLSFISFIIQFLFSLPNTLEYLTKDTTLILTLRLISVVCLLPSIYYTTKFSIAIYASISERYNEREIDFGGSIAIASKKFWRYVGVCIKYFLIIFVPVMGILAPFYLIDNLLLRWTIAVIFGVPGVFLGTVYGFAPIIVITDNIKKPYFKASRELVMGDLLTIAILLLAVTLVFMVPCQLYLRVFNDYKSILHLKRQIILLINQLFFVFVTPFTNSVNIVMYFKLKRNKRIG